jgi:Fe-S cluster biogenesis protein NfuA
MSDTPAPAPSTTPRTASAPLALKLEVEGVLEEIRPAIQMDGGDVELVEVEEGGRVLVRLLGACTGCSMSQLTLKQGIENLLLHRVEGVTSVEAVFAEPEEATQS